MGLLINTKTRIYKLRSQNEAERDDWADCLELLSADQTLNFDVEKVQKAEVSSKKIENKLAMSAPWQVSDQKEHVVDAPLSKSQQIETSTQQTEKADTDKPDTSAYLFQDEVRADNPSKQEMLHSYNFTD